MKGSYWLVILGMTLGSITGCSSTIHKRFTIDDKPATSLSVDARQRVILVTNSGGRSNDKHVVCAEPSPDVFAALAAAASADVAVGEKKVGVSSSLAEAARALGPRTQTIQLLRDGLYRSCEAYMNGIVDWREYKRIVARYDETMITMLAIDSLTQRHTTAGLIAPGAAGSSGESGVSSSAGFTGGPEGSTTLGTTPPGAANPPPSDAQSVAQAVKDILLAYYKLQLKLYELEQASQGDQ